MGQQNALKIFSFLLPKHELSPLLAWLDSIVVSVFVLVDFDKH